MMRVVPAMQAARRCYDDVVLREGAVTIDLCSLSVDDVLRDIDEPT